MSLTVAGATSLALLATPAWARAPQSSGAQDSRDRAQSAPQPTQEEFDTLIKTRIFFDFDADNLDNAARMALDETARWLLAEHAHRILIEGHADAVGPAPYNQALARRRAAVTRDYLVSKGVNPDQIRVVSWGEVAPAEIGQDAVNRRVLVFASRSAARRPQGLQPPPSPPSNRPFGSPRQGPPNVRSAETQPLPPLPMAIPEAPPIESPHEDIEVRRVSLMVGAGAQGFAQRSARDITDVGGAWDARLAVDAGYVGVEAAYHGSAQSLNMPPSPGSSPTLVGNGAEGALRINFTRERLVQPFVFGGLGWTNYTIVNEATPLPNDSDNVVDIPAGGGIALNLPNSMLVDVRGDYRAVFKDSLFDDMIGESNLDSWSASARVGWAF